MLEWSGMFTCEVLGEDTLGGDICFSHPSQENCSWDELTSLCSGGGDEVDDAVKDRGEDLLLDLLHRSLRFCHR